MRSPLAEGRPVTAKAYGKPPQKVICLGAKSEVDERVESFTQHLRDIEPVAPDWAHVHRW